MSKSTTSRTVLALLIGILFGVSLFTFCYARGYSYMFNDPKVCANCHVMRDNFNSWSASSHKSVTCNECHLPHGFAPKYIAKVMNGYRHSLAFTLGPPDVIQIHEKNAKILQENCVGCHNNMVNHLLLADDKSTTCVHCHRSVGHGV